jgi:hypothetical protein
MARPKRIYFLWTHYMLPEKDIKKILGILKWSVTRYDELNQY